MTEEKYSILKKYSLIKKGIIINWAEISPLDSTLGTVVKCSTSKLRRPPINM